MSDEPTPTSARTGEALIRDEAPFEPVDRAAQRRKDDAFVDDALRNPGTRLVVLRAGRHLLHAPGTGQGQARALLPRLADAPGLAALLDERPWVLLGTTADAAVLAIDLGENEDESAAAFDPGSLGGGFGELRAAAATLPATELAILVHARALINWRRRHRFCGVCGAPCRPIEAGHTMECTNCGTHHFPRTDPAVIMLVEHEGRALLARSARFESRMLSVLAGFVEPGESLEQAVAREVHEECGIRVTDIAYRASQPWPFPASIMLGFTARAIDDTITIDDDEIVEAAWFTRADIADRERLGFSIPPRFSIARQLIDEWCRGTAA